MFQAHFILSLHQLWNQPFLQGALILFRGECYLETKSWTLAVLIAIRVFLTSRPSQWTELGHIFYTDTHIHAQLQYIYICISISKCIENHEFKTGILF